MFFSKAAAGAVSGIATPLFSLIDNLFTSDEERAEAKRKLLEMEMRGELEATKTALSAIIEEARSKDPWTSRARPSFLYVIYFVILLCIVGGIVGIWWPDHVAVAASNITNLLAAIPDMLWTLFGVGYLGYTGARSYDKGRGTAR